MTTSIRSALLVLILLGGIVTQVNAQKEVPYRLAIQNLAWSPNGKKIVFSAMYGKADWSDYKPEKWQLFLYNFKSKKTSLLADGALFATFSPDGNSIAFSKFQGDGNWDIVIQDLHTGELRSVAADPEATENGPSWSPDGSQLVFYGGKGKARELFVVNTDGTEQVQISNSSPHHSYNPAWSPKDNQICYYLEKGDSRDQIYLTDNKGSFHKNLSQDTLHNYYPGWAPGGRILHASNDNTLRIMKADGSDKEVISGISSFYGRISPKGKKIAYIQDAGPTQAIAVCKFPVHGKVEKIFTLADYKTLLATLDRN
jgi:TolB protein